MKIAFACLLFVLVLRSKYVHAAYSFTKENTLRTAYLGSYNKLARPTETVNITVALNLLTLNSLLLSDQTMDVSAYFTVMWNDVRLDWSADATYNSDIEYIYSTEDQLWRPALNVENSINDISVISDDTVLMRVEKTGDVTWSPSGIYKTHCETAIVYFPFDKQECRIVLSVWGYTSTEVNLIVDTEAVRMTHYKINGQWLYEGFSMSSAFTSREGASTPEVTFLLKFRRRPTYLILNNLLPMVLLGFLNVLVYKLPPSEGKMGYSLTLLLTYSIFLTIFGSELPTISTSTALISVYLTMLIVLSVISVFVTLYVLICHHNHATKKPVQIPKWLHSCIIWCARLAGYKKLKCSDNKVQTLDQEMSPEEQENDKQITWEDIGYIIDAFSLRIFLFLVVFLTTVMLIVFVVAFNT